MTQVELRLLDDPDHRCAKCGLSTRGTMIHPTGHAFHVPCRDHGHPPKCYVLCPEAKAEMDDWLAKRRKA